MPGHGGVGSDARERLAADRRYFAAVLADKEPDDPRLADPEQRVAFARLQQIVS